MTKTDSVPMAIFWFRRDLRLEDNAGLYYALKSNCPVLPVFIFDSQILDKLEDKTDRRVKFIYQTLQMLQDKLEAMGSTILIRYGAPFEIWHQLLEEYNIREVYANHDYEPYARVRDREIYDFLKAKGIQFKTYKDQCIFEYKEILKEDGKPYTVYTPYSRKWKEKLNPFYVKPYPSEKYYDNFLKTHPFPMPSFEQIGFKPVNEAFIFPPNQVNESLISKYDEWRDFPSADATSRLSIHLRFGTISIRKLAAKAHELNEKWLNELIWRDFYMMILWHFPHVVTKSFKPAYDDIVWRNNEEEFKAWCNGLTGYPIVDAGMRELNQTGFMHNRVRMITASFLTKHLLIDWRWGEAYFAAKLLDYDLSANNGGWQWAAGSGCDAAPYFRIFNPSLQTEKFDKDLKYIKKWVPEFNDPFKYKKPIVDHELARKRVLEAYKMALLPK